MIRRVLICTDWMDSHPCSDLRLISLAVLHRQSVIYACTVASVPELLRGVQDLEMERIQILFVTVHSAPLKFSSDDPSDLAFLPGPTFPPF